MDKKDPKRDALGILSGEVKAAADGTYTYIVSDGKIDRDDEVVDVAGINVKEFNKKPVILWSHQHSTPAIAKAKRAYRDKNGNLVLEGIKFPEPGVYPLADTVAALVKEGIIDSMSIGFRTLESNIPAGQPAKGEPWRTITKSELYEVSFVNVGANRGTERIKSVVGDDGLAVLENPTGEKSVPVFSADEIEEKLFGASAVNEGGVELDAFEQIKSEIGEIKAAIEKLSSEINEFKSSTKSEQRRSAIAKILSGGHVHSCSEKAGDKQEDGDDANDDGSIFTDERPVGVFG